MFNRISTHIEDRESWLEARRANVGASDIAALFACHPHMTGLQLWGEKSGRIERDDTDTPEARRGRIFEGAVAAALEEDRPDWVIVKNRRYYELEGERFGCTPDFFARIGGFDWLVQAKIVTPQDFEEEWRLAPPAHYLLQLQAEMFVTGIPRGILAPMVFDKWHFPVHVYQFREDVKAEAAIISRVRRFWHHVDRGIEPKYDASRDRGTLARLYPDPDREAPLALVGRDDLANLCREKLKISKLEKRLEGRKERIQGLLADELRNHARGEIPGRYRISWTPIDEVTVTSTRKAYRRMTISEIKPKKGRANDQANEQAG